MFSPRPLLLVAVTTLLAACSSSVVPLASRVGPSIVGPALHPVSDIPPAPAAAPVAVARPATSGVPLVAAAPAKAAVPAPSANAAAAASTAPAPAAPAGPATKVALGPLIFISQTLNNCGPASVSEVLHYWGIERSQEETQAALRPDNPYGMTTTNVPSYIDSLGMHVLLGTGGTQDVMKSLLRAGFPVIVDQLVSTTDRLFHYRPIEGFDDSQARFVASDPYLGPDYAIGYDTFDGLWTYTGNRFMVIYPPDKQDQLDAALAAGNWDMSYAEGAAAAESWQAVPTTADGQPFQMPRSHAALTLGNGSPAKASNGSWYSGPVTVTLSASDPSGFGVAATSYQLDGQKEQLYTKPFTVSGPGKHAVQFRSAGYDGAHEAMQRLEIDIDGTAPSTTASPSIDPAADGVYHSASGIQVTLSASDDGSGVAGIFYSLDGGAARTYNGPLTLGPGRHTLAYHAVDVAGNVEAQKTLTLSVAGVTSRTVNGGGAPPPSVVVAGQETSNNSGPISYNICQQYDGTKPVKAGGPLVFRFWLCDASGKNASSGAIPVRVDSFSGPAGAPRPASLAVSYDGTGYRVTFDSQALKPGSYTVHLVIPGDPTPYSVSFTLS